MRRFHVHLGVPDLAASIRFYSDLFGSPPSVEKPDYAKWMLDDPRVNFAISKRASRIGLNHLGLQAESAEELAAIRAQFAAADPEDVFDEPNVSCCYSRGNKHWTKDPQGIAWEAFHTLGSVPVYDEETAGDARMRRRATQCCGPADERAGSLHPGRRRAAREGYRQALQRAVPVHGELRPKHHGGVPAARDRRGPFPCVLRGVAAEGAGAPESVRASRVATHAGRRPVEQGMGCVCQTGRAANGFRHHGLRQRRRRSVPRLARATNDGPLEHSRSRGRRKPTTTRSDGHSRMPADMLLTRIRLFTSLPLAKLDRLPLEEEASTTSAARRREQISAAPLFAEFVGTALLLAVVVGSGTMGERLAGGSDGMALLANSLATGCGLFVLIVVFAPVSGAQFNPLVTLVARLEGDVNTPAFLAFAATQVVAVTRRRRVGTRDVRPCVVDPVDQGACWNGPVDLRRRRNVRPCPHDHRKPKIRNRGRRRCGGNLHLRSLLVHRLDFVRQPRRDVGQGTDADLLGYRARECARIHGCSIRRSRGRAGRRTNACAHGATVIRGRMRAGPYRSSPNLRSNLWVADGLRRNPSISGIGVNCQSRKTAPARTR